MRVPVVVLVLAVLVGIGAGGCAAGCPTGLAEGEFVADGTELALRDRDGHVQSVRLPAGYRVERGSNGLVLVDFFGSVKAREGHVIQFGGGFDGGQIEACEFVGVVPD